MTKTLFNLLSRTTVKEWGRSALLPVLHYPFSSRQVSLRADVDPVSVRLANSPLGDNRSGDRELNGYLLHYEPQPGDRVISAGAYHGHVALYLAHKVGVEGHVYCFEPNRTNLRVLRKNIALNDMSDRITVVPRGLWDTSDTLRFSVRGSSSRIHDEGVGMVPVVSLDEWLQTHPTTIVFIAMDIEGAEIEAMQGMQKALDANPTMKLAIASYHVRDGFPTSAWLESWFTAHKRSVWTEYPEHQTTYVGPSA